MSRFSPILSSILWFLAVSASATPPEPALPPAAAPAEAALAANAVVVAAEEAVRTKVIEALARRDSERSRFSRARMPPAQRRVRILDAAARTDGAGARFVAFAIDARYGFLSGADDEAWNTDEIVGCLYVDSGEVFVNVGEDVRPVAHVLGKRTKPAPPSTCVSAAPTPKA